jgi:hypothetical protein
MLSYYHIGVWHESESSSLEAVLFKFISQWDPWGNVFILKKICLLENKNLIIYNRIYFFLWELQQNSCHMTHTDCYMYSENPTKSRMLTEYIKYVLKKVNLIFNLCDIKWSVYTLNYRSFSLVSFLKLRIF